MKQHGRLHIFIEIDGSKFTLGELEKYTGFKRQRIYDWHMRGYLKEMIPAIKRAMKENYVRNQKSTDSN